MTTTAPTTATAPATAATASSATNPLGSLTNNFTNFLKLLMTQLQNQDPTSPMDTNQFTSQLVQFTSVEQQINTNSSLTKLIQATQGANLLQSSAMIGQSVAVTSDQLTLQDGKAAVGFSATQPTTIEVTNKAGVRLQQATVPAGQQGWNWDGKDSTGRTVPDGTYKVSVKDADGKIVPFTVLGTVTNVQRTADAMDVQLGALKVDLNAVQSVGK